MKELKTTLPGNARRRHWPLSLLTAVAIILVAVLAILYLRTLTALYEKASRFTAAKSVIDEGLYIAQWLSEQPFFTQAQNETDVSANPHEFDRAVKWLKKMQNGVQSVSVSENNVILYQKQMDTGGGLSASPADISLSGEGERLSSRGKTIIRRQKLVLGTNLVPVIVFSKVQTTPDGRQRQLEIALNKAVIERQSASSASALNRMFVLSLATIAIAFTVCLLAIIALVHREMIWQKRSRLDEHLAFAGAVAGSIIHDFRNPLSAMRIDAQLLQAETGKSDCQRGRLRELAERVVKTIDRTDDLLAEFFALGRPEENEREAFNVNAAVTDCVELLKTRFEKAGFHLASDLAHEPLRVQGFPAQFKRAILNILTNAEQFSPAGGRVTIQTRLEKKLVVIRITDEGPGIPTPEREKIFDLFYSNRPSGMGIGLALARTAIENCGGKIECGTPPEGKGTVFTIRIPIRT